MPSALDTHRSRWNTKYQTEIDHARVSPNLIRHAALLKPGRILDLAGGLGQNGAWLASHFGSSLAVDADLSDKALSRAPSNVSPILADAAALPFAPYTFATVLNIRFFEPRVRFAPLLTIGGTVFFETFTTADTKYRPDFNPAFLFSLDRIPTIFEGLELLHVNETDDGNRVYVTIIAQRRFG